MRYNTVYTVEEYMSKYNYTREEAQKEQRHDIIFNKYVDGEATEEEMNELYAIQKELGL